MVLAVGAASCARDSIDREALLDPGTCASCHPAQHAEWAGSMHAASADDPIFRALLRYGQRTTGGALGSLCVGCHAPAALAAGATTDGTDLDQVPARLRGVGCWACHSIDAVTALHNGGVERADDGVERGGIADPVDTPAHLSARTRLLAGDRVESSDACGACHDVHVGDVAIEASYAEWAGSTFGPTGAVPVSCATCHMFGRDGVAAALPDLPTRRLHDHGFAAIDQALLPWPGADVQAAAIARDLAPALSSKLCVVPAAGGVEVQVTLDNVQVGHAFPSGVTHSRRVWVEVEATAGEETLFASGRFAPGEPVSAAADPSLWLLGSTFLGADGQVVAFPWQAAAVDSELLPPSVTTDPLDPRFYHQRTHSYRVSGVPDDVTIAVHVEPVGLDQLDALIASGDLDPAVRERMPRRTLVSLARAWHHADGYGCVP
ncbi:MAG TPA: multiheme c-type cytochrome [Kofleriaceae bacterium]|nr:multiheme c-type cytochrome [Kofleriaceae bacterium]